MCLSRPHLGDLAHGWLMKPLRRDIFSRFRYTEPLPDDQIQVTWLGTAGIALQARGRTLLLDPNVSRPSVRHSLTRRLVADMDAIRRYVPRADGIVCGHAHHDHIADVPDIARVTGAKVIGSSSTANVCRGHGLSSNQILEVKAPQTVELGPFRITLRPSIHGKAIRGRIPLEGHIPPGTKPPLRLNQYRCGDTYGIHVEILDADGLSLFHLGSGDFFPETLEGLRCDVLTPCLYGREHHADYTRELIANLRPRVVIPNHFDDFMRPMDHPIREIMGADLAAFRREVIDSGAPCRLVVLDLMGSFRCGVADESLPTRSWEAG